MGHNVLCTGGQKKREKRGGKMGNKGRREGQKGYDQLVNILGSQKITNFYPETRSRKGEEIFTNRPYTQNKWLTFLLQMVTSKTSDRFYV